MERERDPGRAGQSAEPPLLLNMKLVHGTGYTGTSERTRAWRLRVREARTVATTSVQYRHNSDALQEHGTPAQQ